MPRCSSHRRRVEQRQIVVNAPAIRPWFDATAGDDELSAGGAGRKARTKEEVHLGNLFRRRLATAQDCGLPASADRGRVSRRMRQTEPSSKKKFFQHLNRTVELPQHHTIGGNVRRQRILSRGRIDILSHRSINRRCS